MAPPAEGDVPRPRRRWLRRLLIACNIFVATCIVLTASAAGYYKVKYGNIEKINLEFGVLRPPSEREEDPGRVLNVLLVGSDSRAFVKDKKDAKSFGSEGKVGGQRSDTMIILHIDPRETKAAMLSIPRDLWVPIAGTKSKGRINTAFEGGPERLIKTIDQSLGIPIDHYFQVDFNGFRSAVKAMGGVNVYFPGPARDTVTGLNVPKGGCITLTPDQALAFVRSRHYSYYEGGRWRTDPTGDIGRIGRQQDFMRRVIKKAVSQRNPINLNRLVDAGVDNVAFDEGVGLDEMRTLASRFRSLDPNSVEMLTLPVVDANIGGAAVLQLKQPDAETLIARFKGEQQTVTDPAAPRPSTSVLPSSVRVRVLNGSGVGGVATQVSKELKAVGFQVAGTGDADSFRYDRSVVKYAPGQKDKALFLNTLLKKPGKVEEDVQLKGVDVSLIIGGAWSGLNPVPGASTTSTAPTTTTTAKGKPQPKGVDPASQC